MNVSEKMAAVGFLIGVAIILSFLLSYPVMLLWNYCLVPAIPALAEVGWLQMWGICVMLNLIFGTKVNAKA